MSGAVTVMVIVMMDTVVDALCMCGDVLCALLLPFLQRGTSLGICRLICGKLLSTKLSRTFIEPSAKTNTRTLVGD
jgi:hypothetical protein